jgi:hypothetical protein
MNDFANRTATDLASVYASYFIRDFATNVVRHLGGSYPVPVEELETFVSHAVSDLVGGSAVALNNHDVVNRFIYECANHAAANYEVDVASRDTWNEVSKLPSIHHAEIADLIYTTAALYRKSLATVNVVISDACTAAKTIVQTAQSRVSITETGGTLHLFNWGILNDGMWLHGALIKAFEMASIFRPGDKPVAYYTSVAFDFARASTPMAGLIPEEKIECLGQLDAIIAHADAEVLNPLLDAFNQTILSDLLFSPGHLENMFRTWEDGVSKTVDLLRAVDELSTLARILVILTTVSKRLGDDDLVGEIVTTRLARMYDVVAMTLVGYEALRETKFAESLILDVRYDGSDPKVDVVINEDVMQAFHAAGGVDDDLIKVGMYYDPRRGVPLISSGVQLSTVLANRDNIVPQIIAEDSDRLEQLRANDSAVIHQEALRVVNDVVHSYLQAKMVSEVPADLRQRINTLSFEITGNDPMFNLDTTILNILLDVINDGSLILMGKSLTQMLGANPTKEQMEIIPGLVIANAAIHDAYSFIVDNVDEEVQH